MNRQSYTMQYSARAVAHCVRHSPKNASNCSVTIDSNASPTALGLLAVCGESKSGIEFKLSLILVATS